MTSNVVGFSAWAVFLLLFINKIDGLSIPDEPVTLIPVADGRLHVYVLPVGQGDAQVVQCPNGDLTVMDFGSSDGVAQGFWNVNELNAFLAGQYNRIVNVIISHNHADHTSFLGNVLSSSKGLTGLTNIYVSCDQSDMAAATVNWLNDIQGVNKLRIFNGGKSCGANGIACGSLNICPGNTAVTAEVFAANMGNCVNSNKNLDSIVFKVTHGQVTIMFNGDFEDVGSSFTENGNQKALVDYYGARMQVTIYKLAHHAAQNLANKPISLNAHKPKAIFVSANYRNSNYRHPRCDIIDRLINDVKTLCKPSATSGAFYCGPHPKGNVALSDKLQTTYVCGEESTAVNDGFRFVTNNEFAIYATTVDAPRINLIDLISDGTNWGFINNIQPRNALYDVDEQECGE